MERLSSQSDYIYSELFILPINYENEHDLYTVTFDSNGGSTVEPFTNLEAGSLIVEPTTTKDGYTFLGWYLDNG